MKAMQLTYPPKRARQSLIFPIFKGLLSMLVNGRRQGN